MRRIPLSKGYFALVDDEYFDFVNQWKWHWSKGYAVRRHYLGGGKYNEQAETLRMHREILGARRGQEVDHINGDKLDNQLDNLRFCTRSQNTANTALRSTNTSGFRGVTWNKKKQCWEVYLTHNYKHLFLGYFHELPAAVRAWNSKAFELRGDFAWVNPTPESERLNDEA